MDLRIAPILIPRESATTFRIRRVFHPVSMPIEVVVGLIFDADKLSAQRKSVDSIPNFCREPKKS